MLNQRTVRPLRFLSRCVVACGLMCYNVVTMATRERRIGIRELKSTLSECIREVKAGRTLVVTEHGDPVARMIPETASLHERLDALRRAGSVTWSGRRLRRLKPVARVRGKRTVADLVSENRE
jgi:prevent-host-death family protein